MTQQEGVVLVIETMARVHTAYRGNCPRSYDGWMGAYQAAGYSIEFMPGSEIGGPVSCGRRVIMPDYYQRGHEGRLLRALAHEYIEIAMRDILTRSMPGVEISEPELHNLACLISESLTSQWSMNAEKPARCL